MESTVIVQAVGDRQDGLGGPVSRLKYLCFSFRITTSGQPVICKHYMTGYISEITSN